jgi:hypothetical protein
MRTIQRRSLVAGGHAGQNPYKIVVIYEPHLTRKGKWVWKRVGREPHEYFGTKRLLQKRPELERGSLQWVPLTFEELVARDAAEEGIDLGVVSVV